MVSVDLPLEIIGFAAIGVTALFVGFIYFFIYWSDMRSKNPELHVFNKARNKPFPEVIAMVDLSDKILVFNGEKEKPQDVKLKKDDYGLLLDSRLASKRPKSRLEDGIPILFYGTNFHFPTSPNGARTIVQLVRKIRAEYKQLNFIRDDIVLLELLTKSGDDLPHDIGTVLEMYPFEDAESDIRERVEAQITESTPSLKERLKKEQKEGEFGHEIAKLRDYLIRNEFASIIEGIKGKLKEWKVEPAWFSMKEGLELLPIGTTSADMKRAVTIEKINTQNEMGKPLEWWKQMMPAFALSAAIMVVAVLVLKAI